MKRTGLVLAACSISFWTFRLSAQNCDLIGAWSTNPSAGATLAHVVITGQKTRLTTTFGTNETGDYLALALACLKSSITISVGPASARPYEPHRKRNSTTWEMKSRVPEELSFKQTGS